MTFLKSIGTGIDSIIPHAVKSHQLCEVNIISQFMVQRCFDLLRIK
jgi:hypothetical protein